MFCLVLVMTMVRESGASFSSTSSASGIPFSAANLTDYVPTAAGAARLDASTCRVSWSPVAGTPAWVTFDVGDGSTTRFASATGTSADVAGADDFTPRVYAHGSSWVSSTGRVSAASCDTAPTAPAGVTLTASDGQVAVAWTAAARNGGTPITGYRATATGGATCITAGATSCTITGLTDGVSYAVQVQAGKSWGYGPSSAPTTAIPYPESLMVSSDLAMWLDAADSSTYFKDISGTVAAQNGDAVALWKDKSGHSNDVQQTAAAQRPVLDSAAINLNRVVPDFDGVDDYYTFDPTKMPTGTAPSTTFLAFNRNQNLLSYPSALWWGVDANGQTRSQYLDYGLMCIDSGGNYTRNCSPTHFDMPLGALRIQVGAFVSNSSMMWIDGQPGTTQYGTVNTGTALGYLGYANWNQSFWAGYITEVVTFNRTLTDAERRTMEEYLARKWATPITPAAPVLTSATADSTTSVAASWTPPAWDGGSAVTGYTVTASPGGATCTTTGSTCSVTGLTTGTPYTVTVAAANGIGTGPSSTGSTVTP